MKKLSKLNQRRLSNFKSNKRGYYSFWIFSFLFVISLFADFIANDPVGEVTAKAASTAGVVTGGLVASSALFANPVSITEIVLLPFRLWVALLSFLGIRKKYRPWGVVYDSITKQPLDPAYVMLTDLDGNEVSTSITDIDGRYGFLMAPGSYRMVANKTNYEFPSKRLAGQIADELYGNLYFGSDINVDEQNAVIAKNIPMDPVNFDWNEYAKTQKHWADPEQGVYSTYLFGVDNRKVRVIVLDSRYHQDPKKGILLGETQWRWLESILLEDDGATFTIIASSIQYFPDLHGGPVRQAIGRRFGESWGRLQKSICNFDQLFFNTFVLGD